MLTSIQVRFVVFIALVGMVVVGVTNTPTNAGSANLVELPSFYADSTQGAPAEKTVEQVQKNIQVLTGLPQSQLIPVMNYMSSSLGVRCNFCHVNKDGNWDFPSDAKPEKASARDMIKMVLSVNKTTFKGATEVSCYTCHRGRTHPLSVPTLPIPEPTRPGGEARPAPGAAPGASPAQTPAEAMPTADQILAKYQEAVGAPTAIEKLKTLSIKGTWLTSNGMTFGYELYQSGPDRLYAALNTPRQGMIERGFDSAVGWEQSTRGLRDLSGEELVYLRRYPGLFGNLKLKEQFTSLSAAGKDKIDGRDVYVLRGMTPGGKRERLYFDAATGLLVRRITSTPTIIGSIPEQVDFDDYHDVDGLKLPFKIRISTVDPNSSATLQFTEAKLNAAVDESKFKKPAPKPAAIPAP
jgi:hypothetical protein